jgi:hypothetical protein
VNSSNQNPNPASVPSSQQQPKASTSADTEGRKWSIPRHVLIPIGIILGCWILVYAFLPTASHQEKGASSIVGGLVTIGILFLFILIVGAALLKIAIALRRRAKAKNAASAETSQSKTPAKPKTSGWKIFGWIVIAYMILQFVVLPVIGWGLSIWRPQANQHAVAWTAFPCEAENGDQVVFNHGQLDRKNVAQHFKGGCWSAVRLPSKLWSVRQLEDQPDWTFYIKLPDGRIIGPCGRASIIRFDLPESFEIQPTKDADLKFWKSTI